MVHGPATRRALVPYLILGAALILTAAASVSAARTYAARDRLRFENAADRVKSAIESRLDAYVAMLLGGAGLFAASDNVSYAEFHEYVERLELDRRYPGIQGIGFSRLVAPAERETVAAETRRYVSSFRYWPEQEGPVHAIVYLEPQDARNRLAMGYDMFSEPTRRLAMARARDTAAPAATGRVVLVQEGIDRERQQPGFLIYVPVYRSGRIPDTVEERRRELLGFVYSPFRAYDLFTSMAPDIEAQEAGFDLFDDAVGEQQLLAHIPAAAGRRGRFETIREFEIAGRRWTLVLHSGPAYAATSGRMVVWLMASGGILLSLLLFAVTLTLVRARAAAERTAEELRQTTEALREASRAKDEFLAIVSHELRTPLNAIVGWTAMLRRGQVPPDGLQHAIEVIQRNAAAQTRLVEDLLDLSRAVAGNLRLERREVDVAATLQAAVEAVRPAAAAGEVVLSNTTRPNLGTIAADPSRLHQVVLNLLSNALKFTPPGGQVTLSAERQSDTLAITVADTGVGIPQEFLPHVFDRFRQADTSSTRTHSGIGLGLSIARHIVELHGGTISVMSAGENAGTTCVVRLPVAIEAH